MSIELSKEIKEQIEREALAGQKERADTDYAKGYNLGYETGYEAAGEKYAELWQAAEAKIERYEKALNNIIKQHPSVSGAYTMIEIAKEAITPKTTPDEQA